MPVADPGFAEGDAAICGDPGPGYAGAAMAAAPQPDERASSHAGFGGIPAGAGRFPSGNDPGEGNYGRSGSSGKLAANKGCESVAFCCISTGVFMFPNQRAAEIAVETVRNWLDETGSGMKVVFNVYKDLDLKIYTELCK